MIAKRFQKLLKALFFCPITLVEKTPSGEGLVSFQERSIVHWEHHAAGSWLPSDLGVGSETGHNILGKAA